MSRPSTPKNPTGKRQVPRKLHVPPSSPLLIYHEPFSSSSQTLCSERLNQQLESEIKAGNLIPTRDVSHMRRTKRYSIENNTNGRAIDSPTDKWRIPTIDFGIPNASEISPKSSSASLDLKFSCTETVTGSCDSLPLRPRAQRLPEPEVAPSSPPKALYYRPASPSSTVPPHSTIRERGSTSPLPSSRVHRFGTSPLSRPSTAHAQATRHASCTSCNTHMKADRLVSSPVGHTESSLDSLAYNYSDKPVSFGEETNNLWPLVENFTPWRTGPRPPSSK